MCSVVFEFEFEGGNSSVNFSQANMREDEEEFPEPLPPLKEVEILIERCPLRIRCSGKKCLEQNWHPDNNLPGQDKESCWFVRSCV